MKIALSNSSRIWGGAEVVTETLLRGLQARGHEVLLLCDRGSALPERLDGEIPWEPVPRGSDLNPVSVTRSALVLRRHRPHVVMTMTQKDPRITGPAARLLGIPLVVRHPMDVPLRSGAFHRFIYGWLPTHSVTNSEATRQTILRSADWLDPSSVTVIYNGVDVERIAAAAPADLGLPERAVAIGFIGRFETRKGILELVDAWPRVAEAVPDAHLVLVGEGGREEAEVRERLRSAPRVHWLGFRRDVPEIVHALDILVLPSRWEGFGLVVAEAMSAGTPVVATRATNFPEILSDGVEGRLAQVADADSLGSILIDLSRSPETRERMGKAAAVRADREFDVERMLDEYERLLTEVAQKRR